MVGSGVLIYWANDVYDIRIGGTTLFHFFPEYLYEPLHIDHRLAEGMALHFVFLWFFAVNGLLYVSYTAISGEWRALIPRRHAVRDAVAVALHDLGLRATLPPQGKYNAAQQIAYTSIVLAGTGSIVTGLAIYKPTQLGWLTGALGGYAAARLEHFLLVMVFLAFLLVHVTQVVRAGWGNFASMVMGYRLEDGDKDENRPRT